VKCTIYYIHREADADQVWQDLEMLGCSLLYAESDGDVHKIFGARLGKRDQQEMLSKVAGIASVESGHLPEIDWEAQWQEHAVGYHDGFLEFEIAGKVLKLAPGAGFGDLSHPTTRMTLHLMAPLVPGRAVLDIGCGSGILSVAAVAAGAKDVYGIDIDPEALEHSRRNSELNGMSALAHFMLPDEIASHIPRERCVALMNMITSEQEVAWESLSVLHPKIATLVVSGVLAEQRNAYLALWQVRGWRLVSEQEEEGWLAFVFSK
jgi:ribosomal protein L11 methyltransferase